MRGPVTSEFWVTIVTLLVGGYLAITGTLSGQEFVALALASGGYSVGRGLAKTETPRSKR